MLLVDRRVGDNNAEITKVAKIEIFEAGLPPGDPLLLDPRGK
jgi:hypothetical protein